MATRAIRAARAVSRSIRKAERQAPRREQQQGLQLDFKEDFPMITDAWEAGK